jgi:hypothetical protein
MALAKTTPRASGLQSILEPGILAGHGSAEVQAHSCQLPACEALNELPPEPLDLAFLVYLLGP